MKSALIQLKVEPSDKTLFEKAAQVSGEKLGEFFYRAGKERLRTMMGKPPVKDNTFEEFMEFLKAQPMVKLDKKLKLELDDISRKLDRGEFKTVSAKDALKIARRQSTK